MPKVSVIMGVYNSKNKNLLMQSVESILNQTYIDWELLICNDGSTDGTLIYLKDLAKIDKRIRIISYEVNRGLAYALNRCLAEANGEYIARQDDDDISYPERLEREVNFLDKYFEYAFVGCEHDICDDEKIWGRKYLEERPNKKSFLWNNPFSHPTLMFRKSALMRVNGYRVAKETRRCEDYDLFMRMYATGYKGYNLKESLYRYRYVNDLHKKYRPLSTRVEEAIVRYKGFKELGILFIGIPFIIKPILISFIPQRIFSWIKKLQYSSV